MDEPGKDLIPTSFETRIGGCFGSSYSVAKKDDRTLLYIWRPDGFGAKDQIGENEVPVTISQWARFREAIEDVKIWGGRVSTLFQPWGGEIEYGDASVESSGSNAYPVVSRNSIAA